MERQPDDEFHLTLGAPAAPAAGAARPSPQERRFRDVLGRFATGVTVVTSYAEGRPVGMTCQSFASVSLDPPLVLFCPSTTSRAWPVMRRAGFFCVNLLAADQAPLAEVMAAKGADKFAGLSWSRSSTGAPLLDGVLGHVDCTVEAVHEAGDHHVVIGRVKELGIGPGEGPLLRFRSRYHRIGDARA